MTRRTQAPGECLKPTLERKHALQAARRLRNRDKSVQAYRCEACGGWHVGTSGTQRKARRIPTLHTNHTFTLETP